VFAGRGVPSNALAQGPLLVAGMGNHALEHHAQKSECGKFCGYASSPNVLAMSSVFPRPVPLIGDTSTARERSIQPDGWAFGVEERNALYAIVAARRDVRRYRPDPVPNAIVERVLKAAHEAPSVGHSQPWRFVIVTDPQRRETAAWLSDRERLRQAKLFDRQSERQMADLQLEGIREAPIGIVVCCDRRTSGAGILGRATFPDSDMWSCAAAIQNLWLAARAEGLGVGWVTLFQPDDLASLIELPSGVETLGWLCLGWPDERNAQPGLERLGWSKRQDLADVVLHETWPEASTLPPQSRLSAPDRQAVVGAHDDADVLLASPDSLGVLDRVMTKVVALGLANTDHATLVFVAGDHLVADTGVSAYRRSVTGDVLAAARREVSLGTAMARAAGLSVLIFDAGCSSGNVVDADALDPDVVDRLVAEGHRVGRETAAQGFVVLGEVGIGNTTVAAALASVLLGVPAEDVVGLGSSSDSSMVDRKRAVVRQSVLRATELYGPKLKSMHTLYAALGGPEFAFLGGVILGAVEAGQVVVLDGFATSVCALALVVDSPAIASHLVAGHRSREAGHQLVLEALGLEPLLDLNLRCGEGVGATLSAQMLLTSLRARAATARTE
jgi:nicotinate-nucleotide--dimethylbenzimidazole phosphoribosyltransferase